MGERTMVPDVVVIGGGVVGLSIAWELAAQGRSVRVFDRGQLGQEASWAGAGMLPPGPAAPSLAELLATTDPNLWETNLRGASAQLWEGWSQGLAGESELDFGYRRCGALHIALPGELEAHHEAFARWQAEGVQVERVVIPDLRRRWPDLHPELSDGYYLPDQAQVRNPRLLRALETACRRRGVELCPGMEVTGFQRKNGSIIAAETAQGPAPASKFVIAAGAWSGPLLRALDIDYPVEPIRGQIVLLDTHTPPLTTIVESGQRYIVPRGDGRILIGSTMENVGFDKRNTVDGVAGLLDFATRLFPALSSARLERSWAGLRPRAGTGVPLIQQHPEFAQLIIATGHFRNGLQMSPITAKLVAHLLHQR